MKALERYVKKNKKDPYGKTKPKGKWEGPTGVKKDDQFAETDGKKVVNESASSDETDPATSGMGAYESIRSKGKKKQRSYLDD